MLLLCLLAAYVVVRLAEDLPHGIRGKTPPRHEYRMAKLRYAAEHGGKAPRTTGFGRYCSGLVDDAWNSAIRRRELLADHRAERQAHRLNRKIDRARAREDRRAERFRRRRDRSAERHAARQARRADRDQARRHRAGLAGPIAPEPPAAPAEDTPTTEGDTPTPDSRSEPAPEHTALAPTNHTHNREGVPIMSVPTGETNGLDSAITFAGQMKDYLHQAVTATEQSLANLEAGGVTGDTVTALTSAQEQLALALQAFEQAETELRGHLTVREAYQATPDAGSKEFVTAG